VVSGAWLDDSHKLMEVNKFFEKPERSFAKKNLSMSGKNHEREYYAVFGQYILPPEIFDVLRAIVADEKYQASEINMTYALNSFIGKGLTGIVPEGAMYDIGNPAAYKETFASFAGMK
jgi:UTP-glucose-1-phosphate uridylyltransferase